MEGDKEAEAATPNPFGLVTEHALNDHFDIGSTLGPLLPPSLPVGRYLGECGRLLGATLPRLLDALFRKMDEALNDQADKSANDASPVTVDRVRRARQRIQSDFFQRVRQAAARAAMDQPRLERPSASAPQRCTAAAPAQAELEEILATENLVSKAESRYRDPLAAIDAHLARLRGRGDLDGRANPYAPLALCESFQAALKSVGDLEPAVRLQLYKGFGKQVMDRLGPFYSMCAAAATRATEVHPEGAALGNDSGMLVAPFEQLRDLLHRQEAAGRFIPARRGVVDTGELLGLLGRLDLDAELARGGVSSARLREQLSTVLARTRWVGRGRRALSPEDEDTLDLVFLFFEHLLRGNTVPDAIGVLIARMQIPVAKLALLDKGFFSDPGHPARRLLNHVGQAAVGWSDDDRGPDSLYGMIERVTERLILDFDGDPGLFSELDGWFVAHLAREQAQADLVETRVLAEVDTRSSGLEQQVVDAAIAERRAIHARVPPVADSILYEGLQQVLRATYRTEGPDSGSWRSVLELVDRLLWSVQPKDGAAERRELLRMIPELLRALRARLDVTGCDQRRVARWFRDLQTAHLAVLQGASMGRNPVSGRGCAPEYGAPPGCGLPLGSWLELIGPDGARTRLKLAWRSPDNDALTFVDRHGQRGPRLTGSEVARLLERGSAAVIDDGREPIADRALRSVLSALVD